MKLLLGTLYHFPTLIRIIAGWCFLSKAFLLSFLKNSTLLVHLIYPFYGPFCSKVTSIVLKTFQISCSSWPLLCVALLPNTTLFHRIHIIFISTFKGLRKLQVVLQWSQNPLEQEKQKHNLVLLNLS